MITKENGQEFWRSTRCHWWFFIFFITRYFLWHHWWCRWKNCLLLFSNHMPRDLNLRRQHVAASHQAKLLKNANKSGRNAFFFVDPFLSTWKTRTNCFNKSLQCCQLDPRNTTQRARKPSLRKPWADFMTALRPLLCSTSRLMFPTIWNSHETKDEMNWNIRLTLLVAWSSLNMIKKSDVNKTNQVTSCYIPKFFFFFQKSKTTAKSQKPSSVPMRCRNFPMDSCVLSLGPGQSQQIDW